MATDLLTTRDAARLLSVGTSTLKRWADDGLLEAYRTVGGHRRFSRAQLLEFLGRQGRSGDRPAAGSPEYWVDLLVECEDPLVLVAELLRARSRLGTYCAVAEELGGSLDRLGDRWERGELSVLDEHVASELLARAIHTCVQGIPLAPGAPLCLLLTADGDDHTLGLSLAELCCREAGWATRWAGRRTPFDDLRADLEGGRVQLVAVSASIASANSSSLRRQYDRLAVAAEENSVALVLGGRGAWPERVTYGRRLQDFVAFQRYLHELKALRGPGRRSS
jgi:excisionase family DNA binding protein